MPAVLKVYADAAFAGGGEVHAASPVHSSSLSKILGALYLHSRPCQLWQSKRQVSHPDRPQLSQTRDLLISAIISLRSGAGASQLLRLYATRVAVAKAQGVQ